MTAYKTCLILLFIFVIIALLQLSLDVRLCFLLIVLALSGLISLINRVSCFVANIEYISNNTCRLVLLNGEEVLVNLQSDTVITSFFIALHFHSKNSTIPRKWVCAFYGDGLWVRLQNVIRQWRLNK